MSVVPFVSHRISRSVREWSEHLAERVTKKARAGQFVVERFSPALLRMEINRLDLWKDKHHVGVDTIAGYFSQYAYMPKVVDPKVVLECVWKLDEVLHSQSLRSA